MKEVKATVKIDAFDSFGTIKHTEVVKVNKDLTDRELDCLMEEIGIDFLHNCCAVETSWEEV